jgi:hypothetical protein
MRFLTQRLVYFACNGIPFLYCVTSYLMIELTVSFRLDRHEDFQFSYRGGDYMTLSVAICIYSSV